MRRAALSLAEDVIRPAPPSFVNAEIGPRRALVTERVSLARLERIKRAREAKLNDVVLAVVTGALRRFAAVAEAEPRPLRAMVPVSVRAAADSPAEGNRITFAFVDLPLDEPDPGAAAGARLRAHRRAQALGADRRIGRAAALDGPAARLSQGARRPPRREPADVQPRGLQRPRPAGAAVRRRARWSSRSTR